MVKLFSLAACLAVALAVHTVVVADDVPPPIRPRRRRHPTASPKSLAL